MTECAGFAFIKERSFEFQMLREIYCSVYFLPDLCVELRFAAKWLLITQNHILFPYILLIFLSAANYSWTHSLSPFFLWVKTDKHSWASGRRLWWDYWYDTSFELKSYQINFDGRWSCHLFMTRFCFIAFLSEIGSDHKATAWHWTMSCLPLSTSFIHRICCWKMCWEIRNECSNDSPAFGFLRSARAPIDPSTVFINKVVRTLVRRRVLQSTINLTNLEFYLCFRSILRPIKSSPLQSPSAIEQNQNIHKSEPFRVRTIFKFVTFFTKHTKQKEKNVQMEIA